MNTQLRIPIILGTVRNNRESEKVAQLVLRKLAEYPQVHTELIDVRTLVMPMDDDGTALGELNQSFRDVVAGADAFIIVSPEYNHSFPGTLKRALDMFYEEWKHKAVGVVGVSNAYFGGVRMVEALLSVFKTLNLVPIRPDIYVPNAPQAWNEDGSFKDERFDENFAKFMTELLWMAETLKDGRNR